jgi:hypothetical protein
MQAIFKRTAVSRAGVAVSLLALASMSPAFAADVRAQIQWVGGNAMDFQSDLSWLDGEPTILQSTESPAATAPVVQLQGSFAPAVPEPPMLTLMLTGLVTVCVMTFRRKPR